MAERAGFMAKRSGKGSRILARIARLIFRSEDAFEIVLLGREVLIWDRRGGGAWDFCFELT
jgi:hypothetical protein